MDEDTRFYISDEAIRQFKELNIEEYKRIIRERKAAMKKAVVSIRISKDALAKARTLGRGYSGVLSRIVEYGLNDIEILRRCL